VALYPQDPTLIETVERFTDRVLRDELQMEVFDENALLERMYSKRETLEGVSHIEVPIAKGETGTDISFTPYGANDRSIDGTTPGESRFKDPEAELGLTANIVVPMTFHADFIRLSLIYMAMNRGSRQRVNYVKNALRYPVETLKQRIARQLIGGSGTLPQMTGLNFQQQPGGQHFLLNRSEFPSLIGNCYEADDVLVYTSGTNAVVTEGSTTVQIDGIDLTDAGRTPGVGDSGDAIRIGGTWRDNVNGVDYVIADVVYSAPNTIITLAVPFDGGFSGNTTQWEIEGFYADTGFYGNAGDFSIQKLDKAYFSTVDGSEYPDMLCVDALTFTRFQNELQEIQRWMGSVENLGQKNWMNFRFHNSVVVIDNHEETGDIRGINTNWCKLYTLGGFESFSLNKGSLQRVTNGSNVASVVGEIVVSAQVVDCAPKRSFRIKGINI
jgi:hypothetical protein